MVPAPQGLKDCEANLLAANLRAIETQTFLDLDSDLLEHAERVAAGFWRRPSCP